MTGKIAGSSAIKIQIRVTLIANLLLSVLQSKIERRWSFSGLATIVRIMLMYYPDPEKLLNQPDADWKIMIAEADDSPPDNSVNNSGGLSYTKYNPNFYLSRGWASYFMV